LSREKKLEQQGREHQIRVDEWLRDNNVHQYRTADGTLWRGKHNDEGRYEINPYQSELVITSDFQQTPAKDSKLRRDISKPVAPTRFTRQARHRILEGAACIERRVLGSVRGVFVTFTVPGSTQASYDAISRGSGYVTNRLLQCIRYHQRTETWFYVWELQKRGALHMHLFLELKPDANWLSMCTPLADAWYSALRDVGDAAGCCMFEHAEGNKCTASRYWRFDYQIARKSVGGYISKYVSKTADKGQVAQGEGGVRMYYPRRWHGMSRNLCQQINEERKVICVEGVREEDAIAAIACLEDMASSLDPVLSHGYDVEIGRNKFRDGSFGHSYRELRWFRSTDFPESELVMRTLFIRLISEMRKTRVTFKGFALDYGGMPVPLSP